MAPQYLLVGSALLLALRAFWKGDAVLGFGLLAACAGVYWLMVPEGRPDWLRLPG